MNQSLQIRPDKYVDKGLTVPKYAGITGLGIPKTPRREERFEERIPLAASNANHLSDLPYCNPEQIGFKANVDQLYLWTEEESTRYLLHNIFCFR